MSTPDAESARPAKRQRLQEWCQAPARVLKSLLESRQEHRYKPPRLCISELTISHDERITQVATPAASPDDGVDEPSWLEEPNELSCTGVISGPFVGRQVFAGSLKLRGDHFDLVASKKPIMLDLSAAPLDWSSADDASLALQFTIFTQDTLLKVLGSERGEAHAGQGLAGAEAQMLADMGESGISLQGLPFDVRPALSDAYSMRIGDILVSVSFSWDHPLSSSTFEGFISKTSRQPPSPSLSATSPAKEKSIEITYVAQDLTQHVSRDLTCPLCQSVRPVKFPTFKRLHLHLVIHHDHFRTEVEHVSETTQIVKKIVRLDLAVRRPGKANIHSDDLDFGWVAPRKPFSTDSHLSGDESWTRHDQEVGPPRKGRRGKSQPRKQPACIGIYKRLPPAEVPELRPIERKAHSVPVVFTENDEPVEFFRTNSKRPFEGGEMVENSDDEVDDAWIGDRRRQHLSHLKLTAGKARFMADWDAHMDVEEAHGMSGDTLKRDSAIRFARQCRRKALDDANYRAGWQSKVLRWQKWNIFDQADVDYCTHLLQPPRLVMTQPLARRSLSQSEMAQSVGLTQAMDSTQQRSQLTV